MTDKEEVNGEEIVKDGKTYWMGTEVKPCTMCGKVVTAVDDCGEFGNPECPQFGIDGRKSHITSDLRNPGYIVVLMDGSAVHVFHLADAPKALMIRQFAHLIIPPNNLTPLKDRWSLFTSDNWSVSTEEEVLAFINSMLTRGDSNARNTAK